MLLAVKASASDCKNADSWELESAKLVFSVIENAYALLPVAANGDCAKADKPNIYQEVAVVLYVTDTVSPAVVALAVLKLPSEYKVPAVELCVLTAPEPVTKKQP